MKRKVTKLAGLTSVPEDLHTLLFEHLEKYYPDVSLSQTIQAPGWHIEEERESGGLFKKTSLRSDFYFVLHDGILYEMARPAEGRPWVRLDPMQGVRVVDYEKTSAYKLIPECGVNLAGIQDPNGHSGERFIGLADDSASLEFREALKATAGS